MSLTFLKIFWDTENSRAGDWEMILLIKCVPCQHKYLFDLIPRTQERGWSRGWRDDLVVMSLSCSCRGSELRSLVPRLDGSQFLSF